MMCSSWKLSIFGLAALMLAFALAPTDALAQAPSGYSPVRLAVAMTDVVDAGAGSIADLATGKPRATNKHETMTFTFTLIGATSDRDGNNITVTIPGGGWPSPFKAADDTDTRPGAVVLSVGGVVDQTKLSVGSRQLKIALGKNVADETAEHVLTYKMVTVPNKAADYSFRVQQNYNTTFVKNLDPTGTFNGIRGANYIVTVDSAPDGSGKIELTSPSLIKGADDPAAYKGHYLISRKQALGNLVFRYTAAGTMVKNATVVLELPDGFGDPFLKGANRNGRLVVSGANFEIGTGDGRDVTATLDKRVEAGHPITFTYTLGNAPDVGTVTQYGIEVSSSSPVIPDTGDPTPSTADGLADGTTSEVIFTLTGVHGSGEVAADSTHRTAGEEGNLTLTYTAKAGMAIGAQVEIDIPAGWTPAPFVSFSGDTRAGVITTTSTSVTPTVNNNKVILTVTTALEDANTVPVVYTGAKAPANEGAYTFSARAKSHKQGNLVGIKSPTVHVVSGHGAGSISLTRGGRPFVSATKKENVGNLVFKYTAAGRMDKGAVVQITIPSGWPAPRLDNNDGVNDSGEVVFTGKADFSVLGQVITAKAKEALVAGDMLVITYRNIAVPDVPPQSVEFETRALSFDTGTATDIGLPGAKIDPSPTVGIDQAADGSGTVSLTKDGNVLTSAKAGEALGNLVLTYTAAAGGIESGSAVEFTIPNGWPAPIVDNGDNTAEAGEIVLSGIAASLSISSMVLTVTPQTSVTSGDSFAITYKAVTAPTTGGSYRFLTKSKSSASGTLTALQAIPTVTVNEVASGTVTLAKADGPLTSANPSMQLGNLMFTYTAGTQMANGARVEITIPQGWTPPFVDNNDGTDAPGEVSLAGMADLSVSGGGALPWMLTATTTSTLEVGNTLTFTYKMVTTPPAEMTYTFMVKSSPSAGGVLLSIASQPSVIVRTVVDAITIEAASEFFADENLPVRVTLGGGGGVAKALGDMVVMLSSSAESGSFADADGNAITSITVGDNMSEASATYMDGMAGMVTLTATSGTLTDSTDVEVKSAIRDLVVDNTVVKGGSAVMVSATGKAGGGTVTILDADGEKVGTKKALDPIGDPDADGDQEYSRSVTLPATLVDGMYTLSVEIQGATDNSLTIEVLNDQSAPTLSEASAWPDTVANGGQVALRVTVAPNESMIEIASVTADVSMVDSTRTDPIALSELPDEEGVYARLFTVSADNTNDDGMKTVSFTATDRVGNESEAATASITLKNDTEAPELTDASAMPEMASDGMTVTISVMSESGLTVTADASAIGGDAMESLTEGMDEEMMGTGMYSADVVVTDAADGEQTITITGTDGSGNSSEAMATVMIDNSGPMLSDPSANPAMAKDGTMVTISVMTESGATVMADASAIGGAADLELDESADTAGMYSASVSVGEVVVADGDHMVSITATDALGNDGDAVSVTVTVDNTAPALSDAAITPDWAKNGGMVTISVMTESGATVMADASAIGGAADEALTESADTAGMYSAMVTVTGAMGGDQMVSISASDALGNESDLVSASVSIHVVTSASFSPADVSTGDMVMVSAMGTAGLTATFSVFDADGNNIVTDGSLTEDAETPGSYSGSFEVVIDAHPTGTYWVSATIGQASMTADGALTIDHLAQFTLSIGAGTHLIHVPLDVTHIDGVAATIDTVGDLYDALGDSVNFIISLGADGTWNSYLGDASAGGAADAAIGDDTGLIAVMSSAKSLTLAGNALGTGGASAINLAAGNNLVGVPLDPAAGLDMISDALADPAVSAIVVSNAAGNGFNTVAQAGDPGDGAIMGGVGYIVVAGAAASIPVIGMAWDNSMADDMGNGMTASAAPSIGFQTPVLQVQGKLIDEAGMVSRDGLNVTVKNVTRGTTLGSTTAADDYSMTFVKLDTSAAKVGDVLEIRADSSNPLIGVRPVQHVVTAADVLDSRISLPDLVTYEIPAQTELLANYPNPFNPETWIPFRLAEDSNVSVSIYGASGSLVRTIDIGFTPAAVYEGRSDAIYWDGRNDFGEQVSSGIYFYHLSAGEFSGTRKMVIVK